MSLVIVGSVAFDTIRTPWGDREKIVGGSGTYCSLAASYFTRPRIVGVVGRDFPRKTMALLRARGIDLAGLKIKAGKTFHWEGKYGDDPNRRTTLRTELNVFADFRPRVPAAYRGSRIVYLANLNPEHHEFVLGQFRKPALVAMDTIRLWIDTKREVLLKELGRVDIFFANDEEARLITGRAEPHHRRQGPRRARPVARPAEEGGARRARLRPRFRLRRPGPSVRARHRPDRGGGQLRRRLPRLSRQDPRLSPAVTSAGRRSTAASWPRSPSRISASAAS